MGIPCERPQKACVRTTKNPPVFGALTFRHNGHFSRFLPCWRVFATFLRTGVGRTRKFALRESAASRIFSIASTATTMTIDEIVSTICITFFLVCRLFFGMLNGCSHWSCRFFSLAIITQPIVFLYKPIQHLGVGYCTLHTFGVQCAT